ILRAVAAHAGRGRVAARQAERAGGEHPIARAPGVIGKEKATTVEDTRVSSWNELNERVFEGSWNEELGRFRSNLAFRGMADSSQDLMTSLQVPGGEHDKHEADLL